MDLQTILSAVMVSSFDDWHALGDDAKFKDYDGCVVLVHDLSIKLAWGKVWRDDFFEPWFNHFADKSPGKAAWVDIFYHEMLVYRIPFVYVDGYRYCVPLGKLNEKGQVEVSVDEVWFFALVDRLNMHGGGFSSCYMNVIKWAGFIVTGDHWPPEKPRMRAPARGKRKKLERPGV